MCKKNCKKHEITPCKKGLVTVISDPHAEYYATDERKLLELGAASATRWHPDGSYNNGQYYFNNAFPFSRKAKVQQQTLLANFFCHSAFISSCRAGLLCGGA